jgi:hypothetical protein
MEPREEDSLLACFGGASQVKKTATSHVSDTRTLSVFHIVHQYPFTHDEILNRSMLHIIPNVRKDPINQ